MNKKYLLIPFALGVIALACMGAMIHEYPATTTPGLSDFTLLDTWNGASGAYNSARLSDIRTVMFNNPTFTGTLRVNGTISTNEFGGVNVFTNVQSAFYFGGLFSGDGSGLTNLNVTATNVYTTNLYATNLYTEILVTSNAYVTNLFTTNLYTSNLFATNLFTTNLYSTNIFNDVSYLTNIYSSNAYITNLYTSNLFSTNLFTTNIYASNFFTTNIYTELNVASNVFTTNLYTTNINAKTLNVQNIYAQDAAFTNGVFIFTNTWANAPTGTVDLSIEDQAFITTTDMEITGFINKSNYVSESVVMSITNSTAANKTMYLPVATLPDRTASFTVSNASWGILSIRYHPAMGTNLIWKQW